MKFRRHRVCIFVYADNLTIITNTVTFSPTVNVFAHVVCKMAARNSVTRIQESVAQYTNLLANLSSSSTRFFTNVQTHQAYALLSAKVATYQAHAFKKIFNQPANLSGSCTLFHQRATLSGSCTLFHQRANLSGLRTFFSNVPTNQVHAFFSPTCQLIRLMHFFHQHAILSGS